jgi:hypothetical protein
MDAKVQMNTEVAPDNSKPAEGTISQIDSNDGSGRSIMKFQASPEQPKPDDGKPKRPDHIEEKFWDAEKGVVRYDDLARSYAELQKKLSVPKAPEAAKPEDKPQQPKNDPQIPPANTPSEAEARQQLQAKGVDYDAMEREFAETGALSDASRKALTDAGIPKSMVDGYIAGQQLLANQRMEAVFGECGGDAENYTKVMDWAKTGLTGPEIAAYNRAMDSGDIDQMKLAAGAVYSKFVKAEGSEPTLVGGDRRPGGSDVKPFGSTAELTRAMSDRRYKEGDAAYHAEIDRRLAVSNIF